MAQASINTTSNGPVELIAGVANQTIAVSDFWLVSSASTTFQMKDGATALFGPVTLFAGGSADSQQFPFTLSSGQSLNLVQTGGAQLSGIVLYTQNYDVGYP